MHLYGILIAHWLVEQEIEKEILLPFRTHFSGETLISHSGLSLVEVTWPRLRVRVHSDPRTIPLINYITTNRDFASAETYEQVSIYHPSAVLY